MVQLLPAPSEWGWSLPPILQAELRVRHVNANRLAVIAAFLKRDDLQMNSIQLTKK